MTFGTIGVIGAGNIGASVVTDLVLHGIGAVVVDVSDAVLQRAEAEVVNNIRFTPVLSKTLPRVTADEARRGMVLTTSLADVASCEFIIENVTEDWKIKKDVYVQLDQLMPPHVCFGSNTSCISITQIASATGRPSNVIGLHFMNPVHLKQTVEVIRGFHTSDATLNVMMCLFSSSTRRRLWSRTCLGSSPIVLRICS